MKSEKIYLSKDDDALEFLVALIKTKTGKNKAVTNKSIRLTLHENGFDKKDRWVRAAMQHLRETKTVDMLCAYSKGYYIAESKEEWITYRERFRSRIMSMQYTLACMY